MVHPFNEYCLMLLNNMGGKYMVQYLVVREQKSKLCSTHDHKSDLQSAHKEGKQVALNTSSVRKLFLSLSLHFL